MAGASASGARLDRTGLVFRSGLSLSVSGEVIMTLAVYSGSDDVCMDTARGTSAECAQSDFEVAELEPKRVTVDRKDEDEGDAPWPYEV